MLELGNLNEQKSDFQNRNSLWEEKSMISTILQNFFLDNNQILLYTLYASLKSGRVAQLARAMALQAIGHRFKSCLAYQNDGLVV